jgi:hypothetical protein
MRYFFDTEFIENGSTIDLISIGIVAEDGRTLHRQNAECDFRKASDWVWRNVFPHLKHFNMSGGRSCNPRGGSLESRTRYDCHDITCPWESRSGIRDLVLDFCDVEKFGKPEFWGYYANYDWVVFCQLFGTMMQLPDGFPMYCRDIKQWCDALGNPKLPKHPEAEHNSLNDAIWTQGAYLFLKTLEDTITP